MRRVGKPVFWVVLLLILAFAAAAFLGVSAYYGDNKTTYIKGAGDIRWGIDIRGGVDVTFTPPDGYNATEDEMRAAESIIKVRLVSQNITDYEIYTDYGKNRIIVRFPWKEGEADFNPEKAIRELGETALLTFREGVETDEFGRPSGVTLETIILQGQDVVKAEAVYTSTSQGAAANTPVVSLSLSSEGAKKFSDATTRLTGQVISIWMDDTLLSYPRVNEPITDGSAIISGSFTIDEARDLAEKINGGALPFKLQTENYNTISPTLGMGAKDAMVLAGAIAFAVICAFMIIFYRVPGFIADIALIGQISLIIASVSGFIGNIPSFTLTLPGIAGIILSIGMGVDANVIIGERIKEEIRSGKTIDGAIDAGFNRAFAAIFDGNVTTAIVAIVLMGAFGPPDSIFAKLLTPVFFLFGPATAGTVYSFGYTLLMGVIFNMVMGVYVTRMLMKSFSRFKPFRKAWYYGGENESAAKAEAKGRKFDFDFYKNSTKYFTVSGALLLVVLISALVIGPQLDIQFKGGSMITYAYEGDLDHNAFGDAAGGLLGVNVGVQQSTDVATGTETAVVSLPGNKSLSAEELTDVTDALRERFPANNLRTVQINNVDATIGHEFLSKSLVALAAAAVFLLSYVGVRFRKIGGISAGATAIMALIHDSLIAFGVFVLFGIPLSDTFIAVILTILGYSINATVIVYDRIRENKRLLGVKAPLGEMVSLSINQSMMRSVNTSLTTVLSLVIISVVALIYNVQSILSFSFPLIVGMVAGTYSSLCIAGPLWVKWQEFRQRKKAA